LKLPAFLHGTHANVKTRCRKKAKALVEGATWEELASDWLDTSEVPDLLVLEGPSPLMGKQTHFQLFALGRALTEVLAAPTLADVKERVFRSALDSPWSLLCFMGQHSSFFVLGAERNCRSSTPAHATGPSWMVWASATPRGRRWASAFGP
jgi:hypothetical protein